MQVRSVRAHAGALLLALVAAYAGAEFPRLEVRPESPTTADSLTVRLVLGTLPDDCVFRYSGDFDTVRTPAGGYPPGLALRVDCAAMPPPRGMVCTDTPTTYGPVIRAGRLPFGWYTVYCGASTRVGEFVVVPAGSGYCLGGAIRAVWPLVSTVGTTVRLDRATAGSGADTVWATAGYDTAASDLVYSFAGLDSGLYRLTFVNPIFAAQTHTVVLPSGHMDPLWGLALNVSLVGAGVTGRIEGRTMDWYYRPLPGCSVTVHTASPATGVADRLLWTGTSDSAGSFAFDSVDLSTLDDPRCYVVRAAHEGYGPQVAHGSLEPPSFAGQHTLRLVYPGCGPDPRCASREVDSIRYTVCADIAPVEVSCGDGEHGPVARFPVQITYSILNGRSTAWEVPPLTRACVWTSASQQWQCPVMFMTSFSETPVVRMEGLAREQIGISPVILVHYRSPMAPGTGITFTMPATADTLIGCTRLALADTLWLSARVEGLGEQSNPGSLSVPLPGDRVAVQPAARPLRGSAPELVCRAFGGLLRIEIPGGSLMATEVFGLDGRLVVRFAEQASAGERRYQYRLPSMAGGVRLVRVRAAGREAVALVRQSGGSAPRR